jgi:phytoene dehydrogenase-like protein
MPDVVVIGAGHNGLVAANLLAERGWDVVVLEEQPAPGGATRTAELTLPGFRHDLFSAFYPLTVGSPVMRRLELERHGLRWCRGPLVLAHPASDGTCAVLSPDLDETAASLDAFARGDGDAWRDLYALWERAGDRFLAALLAPFPPVAAGLRLAAALGRDHLLPFARLAVLPVRRLGEERFRGAGGPRLLAGNALHADVSPETAAGGFYGFLLCGVGQQRGFPFPAGGAGAITDALVRRLESLGGAVECGRRVERVQVRGGRAIGVRTADREEVAAGRAVLADVAAPALLLDLVGREHLPPAVVRELGRFQYDNGTVKVDWALDGPIPWAADDARRSPVVHVTESVDELTVHAAELARGLVPSEPFLVLGQYSMGDPTRSPPGKETAWAYAHVPQRIRGDAGPDGIAGRWDERETDAFVARMERLVERLAPGFSDLVLARHVFTPPGMQAADANLVNGALNGGTAQLHQQLVFRPTAGRAGPRTPVARLYLASASAHPGGGVHGACGANAARAALAAERRRRVLAGAGAGAAGAVAAARALRR